MVCLGPWGAAGPVRPGCGARCQGVGLLRVEDPWRPQHPVGDLGPAKVDLPQPSLSSAVQGPLRLWGAHCY